MLEKYGVEYPLQNLEFMRKCLISSFSKKLYTFPSGRVEYCQGYEPRCFDLLLKEYKEEDIVVGSHTLPEIWYENPARDNKLSR
jgi:hypothetical protein